MARADTVSGIPYQIYDAGAWPMELTKRTITLPQGMFEVGGSVSVVDFHDTHDFPTGSVPNLYFISPKIRYGATPLVTVGFNQSTLITNVPDASDPTGMSTTLDEYPGRFALEGIFKFGGYDVGLHVQVPVQHIQEVNFATGQTTGATKLAFLAAAIGRVVFANGDANFRFRAGFELGDASGDNNFLPDLDTSVWYQASPMFAFGGGLGLASMDPKLSVISDDVWLLLHADASYSVMPALDLFGRLQYDEPLSNHIAGPEITVGAAYRL